MQGVQGCLAYEQLERSRPLPITRQGEYLLKIPLAPGPGRIAKVPASCASIPDEKIVALVLNYVTAYQMMFGVAKLSKEAKDQVVLLITRPA